jgi:NAD(P)-dependent dehydrogenase (short-subunit alcohol dehydrogenase family)
MKIIIVGGNGTIGKAIAATLKDKHEIIIAGRTSGDYLIDIADKKSIFNFFEKVQNFDALVCCAGPAHLAPLQELTDEDFMIGIGGKLLSQINLVLLGQNFINKNGSFTLTSGVLAEDFIYQGVAATTADAAINAFVRSSANELKNDTRINVVAPEVLEDSPQLHHYFPGQTPVHIDVVRTAYLKSIFGIINGQIIRAYG